MSIKEFFTTRLMRARSFEGGANSPRDETSNWFDEFKARMTKKSQVNKHASSNNNNSVEEKDDESNDSSCEQGSSSVKFSANLISKAKSRRNFPKSGDSTNSLVKEICDNQSVKSKDVNEDHSGGIEQVQSDEESNDDSNQEMTSKTNTSTNNAKKRKFHKISCAGSPDFDTASINTIFNRRDSRYEKIKQNHENRSLLVRVLNILKRIISFLLPINYNLPWKILSIINFTFVIIVVGLASKTNPDISTFTFLNGFICGFAITTVCFMILLLSIFVQLLPSSRNFGRSGHNGESNCDKVKILQSRGQSLIDEKNINRKNVSSSSTSEKRQLLDDFSSVEVLEDTGEQSIKNDLMLDDDDYKGWMIEFIGDYELRNKSDIKLKLIFVKVEDRVLYLCKPKNSHDAESATFPVFIQQRIYDLNTAKKFSANLLLPKSVRNKQKYVWSKKYPIKLEFQTDDAEQMSKLPSSEPKLLQFTLFAKSCREKEEWFRRFKRIVEENRLIKGQQQNLQKRSSLQSETSEEEGLLASLKSFRRSPSPSVKKESVQTSRSSHLLSNLKRMPEEEKPMDSSNTATNLTRTKSCEQLKAEHDLLDEESIRFVESIADDSTLTRDTAELFSQAIEYNNFLESMPNLSYKDFIEKVIESSQYASSTCDWFNALTGRIFFDVFSHNYWSSWFKRKIQRKLYRIRLPYFMETLTLTKIDLGTNAPQFLNVESHSFDSFGLSINFDMAYSGGLTMTFETKLNLLKIKSDNSTTSASSTVNQSAHNTTASSPSIPSAVTTSHTQETPTVTSPPQLATTTTAQATTSASRDSSSLSDASSETSGGKETSSSKQTFAPSSSGSTRTSGESSDSDESNSDSSSDSSFDEADVDEISDWEDYGAEKTRQSIVRFVDKIASSRYFQHATENRYIKKKLQDISNCPLVLVVKIQSLNGVLTLNVPPPQTDRVWYGFKPNPELTLKALPKMGDREVNLSHVTDWIERKLAEEFRKILVIPNMEDIVLPVLKSDHLLYVTTTK